jgi:hypothetical protein
MLDAALQNGHVDTALTLAFSPIVLGFIVGALPVLVPVLVVRGLSRLFGGGFHTGVQ